MSKSVNLNELNWIDYDRRVREDGATVLLPIGSLEQHGPHSPIGSDEMLTKIIGEEVGRRTGSLVAPSINYGVRSQPRTGGGNHFPGTISLKGETLIALVRDLIVGFVQKGARNILILDTHYENEFFVIEGVEEAMSDLKAAGYDGFKVVKIRYFELLDDKDLKVVFPDGFLGWPLEHAAVMTTSLHLHLTPAIVDMTKAPKHGPIQYPPYDVFPLDAENGTETGCLSSPAPATAEKGKYIFDKVVSGLCDVIKREFKAAS